MLTTTTTASLKPVNLARSSREQVLAYFENTWGLYEALFSGIVDDSSYYLIPDPLRRPLIFYYGHTAVLYINKLHAAGLTERINPDYEVLFETGVDEMSWDDMDNSHFDWPTVSDVRAYRSQVFERVCECIRTLPLELPVSDQDPFWALMMGFEHDRIHLETSSVLIRQLPADLLRTPEGWEVAETTGSFVENSLIEVPAGRVKLGKERSFPSYGWDNEYGEKELEVPAFAASKYLITNGEFLQFVQDGGYETRELWSEEGWQWRTYKQAQHPLFWIPAAMDIRGKRTGSTYRYRAVFDEIDMPWDWPVDVNYYEAKAFCRWKGSDYRVIQEAEWHRLRDDHSQEAAPLNDLIFRDDWQANLNLRHHSSTPVTHYPPTERGFHDVHGNVWEWSEDSFLPFPGFSTHPLYLDFSTPCFDHKHNIMMGGSWISTGDEASIYARYGFRRHFFQHAGFRVAKSVARSDVYDTQDMVATYLLSHYGREEERLPFGHGPKEALQFTQRCSDALAEAATAPIKRALDLGCAVGASSFALAQHAREVLGIDYSEAFIEAAQQLKQYGSLSYRVRTEAAARRELQAVVDAGIDRSRVRFQVGDALALPTDLGSFDALLLANLVCRVPDPEALLARLPALVNAGGVMLITTPFTWSEAFTPKERWLGGREVADSEQGLREHLESSFELLSADSWPFLIQEHQRRHQLVTPLVTLWRRRA